MSPLTMDTDTPTDSNNASIGISDFEALEQRVLRAVELVKHEREQRAAAEAQVKDLTEKLEHAELEHMATTERFEAEVGRLKQERDQVRQRVERMLKQLEEISL